MKQKKYWISWLCLYIICLIGGLIPNPVGFGKVLLILLSVCFFIPGGLLLYDAQTRRDKKALLRLRIISLSSLALTAVMIMLNILSVYSSDLTGDVLNIFLAIVSVPMFAFQSWIVSLFSWSCLFISTFVKFYRQ